MTLLPVGVLSQVAPDYLNDKARKKFKVFRNKPFERAFAYSSSGSYGYGYGFKTVGKARSKALEECERFTDQCTIIAVNKELIASDKFTEQKNQSKKQTDQSANQLFSSSISFLIFFVLGLLSLVIYFRYKQYMAAPDERDDIRDRSLEVPGSQKNVLRKIKNYAERQDWIKVHSIEDNIIVLESLPGFINNGYFFRILLEPINDDRTKLEIGCRPRVALQLWHLYATSQIDRLKNELEQSAHFTN